MKVFKAVVNCYPYPLASVGRLLGSAAKENPLPRRSRNMTLAEEVNLLGFYARLISF